MRKPNKDRKSYPINYIHKVKLVMEGNRAHSNEVLQLLNDKKTDLFLTKFRQGLAMGYFDDAFFDQLRDCQGAKDRPAAYVRAMEMCDLSTQKKYTDTIIPRAISCGEFDSAFYALMNCDSDFFDIWVCLLADNMVEKKKLTDFLNFPFAWRFSDFSRALSHGSFNALIAATALYQLLGDYQGMCQAMFDTLMCFLGNYSVWEGANDSQSKPKRLAQLKTKLLAQLPQARRISVLLHSVMTTHKNEAIIRDGSGAVVSKKIIQCVRNDVKAVDGLLLRTEGLEDRWSPDQVVAMTDYMYLRDKHYGALFKELWDQKFKAKDEFAYDALAMLEGECRCKFLVAASISHKGAQKPSQWIREMASDSNLKHLIIDD